MDALTPEEEARAMPDDQLAQTVQAGTAELARRTQVREAERTTDEMALSYLQAAGRQQGEEWQAPLGFVGAYPRGFRVTLPDGRAFEAAAPGVTTPPPDEGCWSEVDPDTDPTPFWEPGAYGKGALVRDAGLVWRALADGTDGPRPSEYPGGWTLTG